MGSDRGAASSADPALRVDPCPRPARCYDPATPPYRDELGVHLYDHRTIRALLRDPPILVADEPTASLDEQNGARVIELLTDAAHASCRTVITVTHDRRLINAMDQMARLDSGRCTE